MMELKFTSDYVRMTVPKSMGGFPAYTGKSSDDGMKKYIGVSLCVCPVQSVVSVKKMKDSCLLEMHAL